MHKFCLPQEDVWKLYPNTQTLLSLLQSILSVFVSVITDQMKESADKQCHMLTILLESHAQMICIYVILNIRKRLARRLHSALCILKKFDRYV